MTTTKLLPVLSLLLIFTFSTHAQVLTPPKNVTTGFVRFGNATRQVTWFYTPSGLVIYDGDVVFGTVAEFNKALVNVTYNSEHGHQPERRSYHPAPNPISERSDSFFPGSPQLWPQGLIHYRYFDSNSENELSFYVNGAINVWGHATCVGFQQEASSSDPNGADGVVTILANSPNNGYCAASLGYDPSISLWMELDTGGACRTSDVIHAWGHVLGLINEQKRPDAQQFDPFVCSNLIDYPWPPLTPAQAEAQCCGAFPSFSCCGFACAFAPEFGDYNSQDIPSDGGAFDLNSVMLFPNNAYAKPGTTTLTNSPPTFANIPSGEDISRVRELYGCLSSPTPPTCPAGCNPDPGANQCSVPTAEDCIYPAPDVANPRGACACRPGFKATAPGIADTDTTKQWRLPAAEGNFRVWVAEGVVCDTLCTVPYGPSSCQEVVELSADCLHN